GIITLLVLITVYVFRNPEKLIDRTIKNQIKKGQRTDLLEDSTSIVLLTVGTGTPFPGDRLPSCNAVFVNGHFFIFDIGPGTVAGLEKLNLPLDRVDGIFLTHWHSDHFMDLPYAINRTWQMGRTSDLTVYGPEGLDSIMQGVDAFLYLENQYRVDHHGPEIMDPAYQSAKTVLITAPEKGSQVIYQQDGIKITAFGVCHEPVRPAYGFRIEYQEKVLVLSGDTKKCDQVIQFAQDADLLLHEAMAVDIISRISELQHEAGNDRMAHITEDILNYHTSPAEAATVAAKAQVKALVLNHLAPPPDNALLRQQFTKGLSKIYAGPITLACDGDQFTIE
ncbi:MAG: MBL fold metallo-hydrolase, partial [Bacteroidota bacterium]